MKWKLVRPNLEVGKIVRKIPRVIWTASTDVEQFGEDRLFFEQFIPAANYLVHIRREILR